MAGDGALSTDDADWLVLGGMPQEDVQYYVSLARRTGLSPRELALMVLVGASKMTMVRREITESRQDRRLVRRLWEFRERLVLETLSSEQVLAEFDAIVRMAMLDCAGCMRTVAPGVVSVGADGDGSRVA